MVENGDYDFHSEFLFCEPCTEGKYPPFKFGTSISFADIVYGDICGKIFLEYLSKDQHFLTF